MIKKIEKFPDKRGWLAEFWRNDQDTCEPVMAYVSLTKPGVVRGPHEHKKQSDFFIFMGPGDFMLHLWDRRKNSATRGEYFNVKAGQNNPVSIVVPPGLVHGYKCVSKTDALCINLADKLYKGKGKKGEVDEIRWEEKEDSPYKID